MRMSVATCGPPCDGDSATSAGTSVTEWYRSWIVGDFVPGVVPTNGIVAERQGDLLAEMPANTGVAADLAKVTVADSSPVVRSKALVSGCLAIGVDTGRASPYGTPLCPIVTGQMRRSGRSDGHREAVILSQRSVAVEGAPIGSSVSRAQRPSYCHAWQRLSSRRAREPSIGTRRSNRVPRGIEFRGGDASALSAMPGLAG